MPIFASIVILLASFFLIGKSVDILIKALANLGKQLKWSEFVVGFIILGLATSTPELFVALNAGREGLPQLSLGNLLGGIVVLFTLLVGLNTLFQGVIATDHKFSLTNIFRFLPKSLPFGRPRFFVKDLFLMAGVIIFPLFLLLDGYMSRIDGLILIVVYLLFIIHAIYDRRMQGWEPPVEVASWRRIIFWSVLGLSGLFVFSWLIVKQALILLAVWQIPALILGLLLLAIGTNLPELTLTIKARRQHGEVVIGDILGSAMANILVLGILALIYPFQLFAIQPALIVSASLIAATVILIVFLHTKKRLERWEGGVLVILYFLYLFLELYFR